MAQKLNSWTSEQIRHVYEVFGQSLMEYEGIAQRLGFELPLDKEIARLTDMRLDRAEIVCRMFLDIKRINAHLQVLDTEIKRRRASIIHDGSKWFDIRGPKS